MECDEIHFSAFPSLQGSNFERNHASGACFLTKPCWVVIGLKNEETRSTASCAFRYDVSLMAVQVIKHDEKHPRELVRKSPFNALLLTLNDHEPIG